MKATEQSENVYENKGPKFIARCQTQMRASKRSRRQISAVSLPRSLLVNPKAEYPWETTQNLEKDVFFRGNELSHLKQKKGLAFYHAQNELGF